MLSSYIFAAFAIATVMVLWAFVQRSWGRVFLPDQPEMDALEQRISCGNCGCVTRCAPAVAEESGRVSLEENDLE